MHPSAASLALAHPGLVARYEQGATLCGRIAMALGLAVLAGWSLAIGWLTQIAPQWAAMQPVTALTMILGGIGLLATRKSRAQQRWRSVQHGAAALVSLIALLSLLVGLLPDLLAIDPGIDHMFHFKLAPLARAMLPGQMAKATAINFMLMGGALALLDTRARRLVQILSLLCMCIASLAILGYLYNVSSLYRIGLFSTVALHTAMGHLVLAAGILLARPTHGVCALLVGDSVGGALARRLLPLAVAAPLLLGWLGMQGERLGIYEAAFGIALTAVAYIALFTLFTWRMARELQRADFLRYRAEARRQEKRGQLDSLIESAMDAIVMLDEAQNIVVFNPSAELMFGYASADILGKALDTLLPHCSREGHGAKVQAFGDGGATSRRMGSLGLVTALRADGREFSAEASISRGTLGGKLCYTAIVRDISVRVRIEQELHASERRERARSDELKNLLFAVPAAVCFAHDDTLAEIHGNEVYDRWLGNADQAGTGDMPSGLRALQAAAAGKPVHDYEFRHTNRDGSTRYLLGNAMPLRDEDGQACGAVSVFIDVTDLKLSEMAMVIATAGSVAKSDYITHMTHELRTPLNTILGYAQMLENATPLPTQLGALRHIIKAGWHLRDLIAEVQELATIEANSAGMAAEPILIDGLIDDLCGMIGPLLLDAGLRIGQTGPAGLAVHANPLRLKQILFNLLSNAIKYNRRGGSIEISRSILAGGQVRIGVRDAGHGLTSAQVASLFQPFNRLGQEHGSQVGTGVGLVVTKKLVESMGGTIGAESDVGSGSLFWFNMPAAADDGRVLARQDSDLLC